jgi:hypothetical protein
MKKTDIAELVTDALKTESKHFRKSELQCIRAVNNGQHGELKPLPKPTRNQLREAFKAQRFNWWRGLFSRRVTLDEAAGMLLGFSKVMAMDAKFVDTHKSNARAPRLMSFVLVTAFTDMRGHVEVALQKKELFADRDGRINSIDLIEWAKEKGYVADEVLAAWGAYNQSEAGEAGQAGAPAKAESKPGDAWKAEALEKAKNIIARQGEKGLHPNLQIIADEIAKDWRSQRKHGPKGTPLTGAYIKRHALQRTGIAIDRSSIISA